MKYLILTMLACSLCLVSLASADPVNFSWDAHPGPIAGFRIYQTETPGVYGAPVATVTPGTATTHAIDIPQKALATTYYFTITAITDGGAESEKSNEASKVIPAMAVVQSIPRPGTPSLTVSSISETGVEVSWLPVDDGTGTPAKIDLRISLASITVWGEMTSQACDVSPCTITGLTPGTKYRVRAVAWRPGVKNVFSFLGSIVSFDTLPRAAPIPDAPKGLIVTKATPTEVIISASASDCPSVSTSTKGSSSLMSVRTVSCGP